jgi:hypothetical protein
MTSWQYYWEREGHKDVVKGPSRIVVVKASNSGSSLAAAAAASAVSCLP